ncbi:Ig-like domain-containing protein [Aquimarina brevivitae]|uniref:Putative secreted protein (Por secretion system target) n=1 Tax=Aquimarina brevivitae TaxID=323412 RepID=A0A4Q7PEU1_9FLAO|nr:Ig-like domain-containing protein [Aquimarina brevivitae]RZS98946.1 putative secreted protein (Por secretion system target) [Aquimarina brevivitae]
MKKHYVVNLSMLILICYLSSWQPLLAQTTEVFEDETPGTTSFTDNGQSFSIISTDGYDIEEFTNGGYNGTNTDNRFIDNSDAPGNVNDNDGTSFSITSASGFTVKDLYLFVADPTGTGFNNPSTGSLTVTGNLSGSQVYTFTLNSGFSDVTIFDPDNGFTFIDFSSQGSDYSNTTIDELIFTGTNEIEYLALDAFRWDVAATNNAPVIGGTVAGQIVNDNATIAPFSAVTITDADGDNVSATITLDDNAKGALSGTGLSGTGPYTIASTTPSNLQSLLRALSYNPTDNRAATSETTTFTVVVNDGTVDTTDNTTTVISNAVAPVISNVIVPANATYATGQTLAFTVNFNENIITTTTGGTPQLAITIGGTTRQATYTSGINNSAVFQYVVQAGDLDTDGIVVGSLSANGGTIQDSGGANANLTLNNVGSTSAVLVDGVAPTVTSISRQNPTTTPTNADALTWGVTFSEAVVNVDTNDFSVSGTTASITNVTNLGGNIYAVTASGGDLAAVNGTVTLSFAGGQNITDSPGNALTNTTPIGTNNNSYTLDNAAPSGYTVTIDQSPINTSNETATSFTFAGAEVGVTYNYTFSSSGGGTNVTGSGTVATATDQITGIDLSGLGDGTITLNVTLTDSVGNTGSAATDTETKDTTAPSGYTVTIDQSPINTSNETATSFTFAGAEVGATYNYTFSSSGGGTNVTGSGTVATATDQITGIDLSGLGDGTITLSVTLTDSVGNTGSAATDTETKDTTAPSGYTVTIDQSPINTSNETATSFTFAGAEVGATYNYTLSSSGGGTNVTGSGTIATATDQITGIDLSGLADGTITLSVSLTDTAGNEGNPATDTETKDTTAPSGYTVAIDQSPINTSNETATSFTFAGAEVGATYNYTLSSSGGGTNVTGSGTIATATDQITGIDLSGLADGTITLSVSLTDTAGNEGNPATDTETKDTTAPSGYTVAIDQSPINTSNETATSFTFAGAEVGATYNYTLSSSGGGTNVTGSGTIAAATDHITGIDLSGLADGTITLSVTLTDTAGNEGNPATDTETKDTTAPSGYTVAIDQSPINTSNETATSFTFAGAEVGATYNYTLSSSGGGTNVTGSGTVATATDQITGIDLSGLADGTITLNVILTDTANNTGSAATDTETKETVAPRISSITRSNPTSSLTNSDALQWTITFNEAVTDIDQFDFLSLELGSYTVTATQVNSTTYNVTFSGGDVVNFNGTVSLAFASDMGGNIDIFDTSGNRLVNTTPTGTNEDSFELDNTAPSGYTVTIDQSAIVSSNESAISFTFASAEVGATYNYTFSSDGGGTNVTGSGTIATATDQITGIDLSGLADGTITLSATLTDPANNTGSAATDSITKDTTAPSGYTVAWDDNLINSTEATSTSFTVANAEIGADLTYVVSSSGDGNTATINNNLSISSTTEVVTLDISALVDGILTVEVFITDSAGNNGSTVTDNAATLDQTAPTVSINSTEPSPTDNTAIAVTVTFSEDVTGFELADLTISNGTASNLAGTGLNYTFTLNPTAAGTVSVDINADSATDDAGNGNTAASQFTIEFDPALSVEDELLAEGLKLYPNPNNTGLLFVSADSSLELTRVAIFDLTGKLVLEQPLDSTNSLEEVQISNLEAGVYMIEIKSLKGSTVKRIVIQ